MSRTYKYPRTHLSGSIERVEDVAQKRIRKKLEIQKRLRKKRAKKLVLL